MLPRFTKRQLHVVLLLLAAVGLVVWLFSRVEEQRAFIITAPAPQLKTISSTMPAVSLTTVETQTVLEAPRYTGQDAAGRRWLIEASNATQLGTAVSGSYVLQQVSGSFAITSGTQAGGFYTIVAPQGEYWPTANRVTFSQQATLTGQGLTLVAQQLTANLLTRQAVGRQGITLQGQNGTWQFKLKAPTFTLHSTTAKVTFTGGVQMHLTPVKGE